MTITQMVWQKMLAGGVYMFPLFFVSFCMFLLIVHCLYTHYVLHRAFKRLRGIAPPADPGLASLAKAYRQARCPVPELNERLREELGRNFVSRLGIGGKVVLLCGSVAMLMGLLGTVSGMINAFEAIQTFGVGNTKSFAAGISEALLTTQSGLLVGVTGVVAGQFIKRRNNRLQFKVYRYFDSLETPGDAVADRPEEHSPGEHSHGA